MIFAPGEIDFDSALQKTFGLWGDSSNLAFRAEFFNVLNHPNFGIPNRIAFAPGFGSITSAADAREVQLGLKITF
jgi:hypothetical protein